MKKTDYRDRIYKFLVANDRGATASDIAEAIGSNRMTVTKYLDIMKGQDIVGYMGSGMAKLWRINPSPLLNSFAEGENLPIKEAMNLLGEGICIIDRDMKIVWYNEAVGKYLGKLEKSKGKICYDFCDLKPNDDGQHCVIKTLSSGEMCKSVQRLTLKNGKTYFFDVVTTPIKDKKNNVIAAMVLMIDLSDYQRKMGELRALLER
jgi:PAS domain-containing protein